MDQASVIQTPQKKELQPGKRTFSEFQSDMDIDGKQSKRPKGDEESDSQGVITKILDKGKSILQITQGSSEYGSAPKAPTITIEHLTSTLLSTGGYVTSIAEGTSEKYPSLFSHYSDIRRNNQELRKEMYPQVTSQTKFLSIDYKKDTFNLVVLESKVPRPLTPADYKDTQIRIKIGSIHPGDMIELHKQPVTCYTGECCNILDSEKKMREMVIKIDRN
jgi:hypothetical protein